jgi:hypothetical protein
MDTIACTDLQKKVSAQREREEPSSTTRVKFCIEISKVSDPMMSIS